MAGEMKTLLQYLHVIKNVFLHFANFRMIIEPSLNLALVARILTGGIRIDFLLLFFTREDEVLDEAHAPVGEVVVVLVGIGSSDSPILNGRVLAGLVNKKVEFTVTIRIPD